MECLGTISAKSTRKKKKVKLNSRTPSKKAKKKSIATQYSYESELGAKISSSPKRCPTKDLLKTKEQSTPAPCSMVKESTSASATGRKHKSPTRAIGLMICTMAWVF